MTEREVIDAMADKLTEAMLKPLREVGELLAKELDKTRDEVVAMRKQLNELDAAYVAHLHGYHDLPRS